PADMEGAPAHLTAARAWRCAATSAAQLGQRATCDAALSCAPSDSSPSTKATTASGIRCDGGTWYNWDTRCDWEKRPQPRGSVIETPPCLPAPAHDAAPAKRATLACHGESCCERCPV